MTREESRKVILTKNRSGKTTRIVEKWLNTPNSVLLVYSTKERNRIIRDFRLKPDSEIITPQELDGRFNTLFYNKNIFVDNADIILENLLRIKIDDFTVTGSLDTISYIKDLKIEGLRNE